MRPPARRRLDGRGPLSWTILAAALFACAFVVLHLETLRAGPSTAVSIEQRSLEHMMSQVILSDQLWVVWVASRNARQMATAPAALFDAEDCFPTRHALAFGEPVITLGLLGVPAYEAGFNPIGIYNFSLFALWMMGGMAMYYLVTEWTAVPAAGIVAGLLALGEPARLASIVHPYVCDTAWTVWSIFFAQRLLDRGRWRDAAGLAVSGSLQIGAGLYPLLGGLTAALPLVPLLLWRLRPGRVALVRLALAAACVALAAWWIFSPYLELRATSTLLRRSTQVFTPLHEYLPGGNRFPGWLSLVFALASVLFVTRSRSGPGVFDARPALLVGGLLSGLVAAGPHLEPWGLPNVYGLVASRLPGLESIRVPGLVACGASLVLFALAGYGAAAFLGLLPARGARIAGVSLACGTFLVVFDPLQIGTGPAPYRARQIAPTEVDLDFYRTLAARGNDGPIVELPTSMDPITDAVDLIFLSAFHRRQTSACRSSFYPPEYGAVKKLGRTVPDRRALAALRRLGFTTIVLHMRHLAPGQDSPLLAPLRYAASEPGDCLSLVYETESRAAFEIGPAESCEPAPVQRRRRAPNQDRPAGRVLESGP